MFKGFGTKQQIFHSFPHLNFQMNNEAYGFSGWKFLMDSRWGLSTQVDGANVSRWESRFGGYIFSQPTAGNQPIFDASDANFNNLPTVDFSLATRCMDVTNSSGIPFNKTGGTIVAVVKVNSIGGTNRLLADSSGDAIVLLAGTLANASGIGFYRGDATQELLSTVEDTNVNIIVISSKNIIVVNGVDVTSSPATIANSRSISRIGSSSNNSTNGTIRGPVALIGSIENGLDLTDCINISDNVNLDYAIY